MSVYFAVYFAGYPFMKPWRDTFLRADFTEPDHAVKQYIMHYYSNFAHTG